MTIHICQTCGTSFPDADAAPDCCPICEDERQFVPRGGQAWTTRPALASSHANLWRRAEPDLFEIRTTPDFGIGQRAFLLRTSGGNVLWDCIALLDPVTEAIIHALGGLCAIAISHPHYYTTMQDWAQAFDAPVHLHSLDHDWVMRPARHLNFWNGDRLDLGPGLTLIRLGGHFPGATVLHWANGAEGRGALLSGDTVQVVPGAARVSFMWSYPNLLPLSAATVSRIATALDPWPYDRIWGAFAGREILGAAKRAVAQSADRYIRLLENNQI